MTAPTTLTRLRGATVGAVSALTGIGAHAAAAGMLPDTSSLMLVIAAAVALGLGVAAAPALRVLPALVGGQLLVHVLLVITSGHHGDMLTAPMAAMHAVGTVAALLLLVGAELLLHAAAGLAQHALPSCFRPLPRVAVVPVPATPAAVPAALIFLGAVGRRGPPSVQ
ncbi:hypothetical protein [Gordonia phthalatica]|uniref:Uncharacterized protein n=1 Tax=Gordonia phthalatica TaxID=1136941 RepID=A0A0N9N9T6_9ACTN|nr:hypothetical protein [Gordonia phthalatica]ALG84036.1 hypothetical protein ACH46_05320 [Gordonia phthalatica]